jgi:hypothetical protein
MYLRDVVLDNVFLAETIRCLYRIFVRIGVTTACFWAAS